MSELTLSLWRSAPLDSRLRFASELLPSGDSLQGALKEAIGVVQLWRRGPELEAWAKAYPSLVVDTAMALEAPAVEDDAHQVAAELLRESRGLLDSSLHAFGFEWITPRPGDAPSQDCRCEGEGPVVASCARPGLRHHGALLIPAEVRLGSEGSAPPLASGPEASSVIGPTGPLGSPMGAPEWLRRFQQGTQEPWLNAVQQLAGRGDESDVGLVISAAEGLRSILVSPESASLRAWLEQEAKLEVIEPKEGDAFDPLTMQAAGERRTVHDHEADTVARLERPGFSREGRVLVPAEVVRYVAGEAW